LKSSFIATSLPLPEADLNTISLSQEIFSLYRSILPDYILGRHPDFINNIMISDIEGFNTPKLIIGNKYSFSAYSPSSFHQVFANHGKFL